MINGPISASLRVAGSYLPAAKGSAGSYFFEAILALGFVINEVFNVQPPLYDI